MKTQQIDLLNIGLIVLSAVLAYLFPLQLFIIAFAILGPIHYFTEISWLDKKNYFTNQPKKYWLIIGIIASAAIVFPKIYFFFFSNDSAFSAGVLAFNGWTNGFIFLTLILSIGFAFVRNKIAWVILGLIGIGGAILLNDSSMYKTIIGLLIPTVIHVYLFTLLFMLYGALKSKSERGYLAVLLALAVPVVFAFLDLEEHTYLFSDQMKSIYLENNLHSTPTKFAQFMGVSDGKSFYFYETLELKLMMFISFIYLYHYLNWFSKTSIIGWHKSLTTKTSLTIGFAWIILLGLFYYDYRAGFVFALFFSFLHVILEFPLNLVSIKGIFVRK
jgi:hypothetical protein